MKYMTPQWYMMCQELHPSAKNERSIREAMEALTAITGENATEAVIDRVFSDFCVGK